MFGAMSPPDESAATQQQLPELTKLPPLANGTTVHRRPMGPKPSSNHSSKRFFVSSSTPFRSVTTRVRKQLDKNLRTASSTQPQSFTSKLSKRDLPLSSRIQALQQAQGSGIGLEDSGEVVVAGTGKAIEKVVNIAAFFRSQGDCVVMLRTTSLGAVDDIVSEGQEEEAGMDWEKEAQTRKRMVSCLEVSIKLR